MNEHHWTEAGSYVHIASGGHAICNNRRLRAPKGEPLAPHLLVKMSPGDCPRCCKVFNALIIANVAKEKP